MPTATVCHEFDVAPARVFAAISEIERFPDVSEDVLAIEFLTESRRGVHTRFRETRQMGKAQREFELEVTEYDVANMRFAAICVADGVTWDTTMTVEPMGTDRSHARLTLAMRAIGHTWGKRLMTRMFLPFFRRGMKKHMTTLEGYFATTAIEQSRS